jgi:hypothetical protein
MIIYWRTKEIWCPYPANDCIDKRVIEYSKSKKKFNTNIFMETDNQLSMEQRKIEVEKALGVKLTKFIRL